MTKLSVNINKIATLRNARGGNNPDVVKVALDCEKFGAEASRGDSGALLPAIRYSRDEFPTEGVYLIVCPGKAVLRIWSCATLSREPCQAGNRAALSGPQRVPRECRF